MHLRGFYKVTCCTSSHCIRESRCLSIKRHLRQQFYFIVRKSTRLYTKCFKCAQMDVHEISIIVLRYLVVCWWVTIFVVNLMPFSKLSTVKIFEGVFICSVECNVLITYKWNHYFNNIYSFLFLIHSAKTLSET